MRERKGRRPGWILVLLLGIAGVITATAPMGAATTRVKMTGGMMAALTDSQELFLEAPPLRGEGAINFSERLTGSRRYARRITRTNGKRPRRLYIGQRYRVPYEVLSDRYKLAVMRALFPGDTPLSTGWEHTVSARRGGLNLWRIVEWFTGDGKNFRAVRASNELQDEELSSGQHLLIPQGAIAAGVSCHAATTRAAAATGSCPRPRVCPRRIRRFRGVSPEER